LNSAIKLPTYKVLKYNYKEQKGKIPVMDETLTIQAPNYASVSGKRIFITPNMFNKTALKLSTDSARKHDIVFMSAHTEVDSVHITIPVGYMPEAIPKNIDLVKPYATYSVSYSVNNNSILLVRKEVRKKINLAPTQYPDVVDYFNIVSKADNSRMVFVKKEN
jgi:hypothetical protein